MPAQFPVKRIKLLLVARLECHGDGLVLTIAAVTNRNRALADITDMADDDPDNERIEIVGGQTHRLDRKTAGELEPSRFTRVDVRHASDYLSFHRTYLSAIPSAPSESLSRTGTRGARDP